MRGSGSVLGLMPGQVVEQKDACQKGSGACGLGWGPGWIPSFILSAPGKLLPQGLCTGDILDCSCSLERPTPTPTRRRFTFAVFTLSRWSPQD